MTAYIYRDNIYQTTLTAFFESEAEIYDCDNCTGDYCYCPQPLEFIETNLDTNLVEGFLYGDSEYHVVYDDVRYELLHIEAVLPGDEDRELNEGPLPEVLLRLFLREVEEEYDE